jgi:putative spermidine/putrescine transport system substrate-binding protein
VADAEGSTLFADAKKIGIEERKTSNGNWTGVKAHLLSGAPGWDIISIGAARCEMASQLDMILPIDYSIVDKSAIPAGLAKKYYVEPYTFTYGLAYQKSKYGNNPPKSWADFWDVKKFPGRRSLENEGLYALEAALLADGVPKEDVYKTLRTPAGLDRAFKKMEEIKPYISVWWTSVGQAMQLAHDGEVDMVLIASARVKALSDAGASLGFVWNQAFTDYDCFMVPKTASNPKAAMQLINIAFGAKGQAEFGELVKNGPVNPKAFELGIITPENMSWIATSPQNIGSQVFVDPTWYGSPEADAAYLRFSKFKQQ